MKMSSDCGQQCTSIIRFARAWRGCGRTRSRHFPAVKLIGLPAATQPKYRYYPDELCKMAHIHTCTVTCSLSRVFEDRKKKVGRGAVPLGNRNRSFPLAPRIKPESGHKYLVGWATVISVSMVSVDESVGGGHRERVRSSKFCSSLGWAYLASSLNPAVSA